MADLLEDFLLSSEPAAVGLRLLALFVFTLAEIYWILRMNRGHVVVLSHLRVISETALMSVLGAAFYEGFLWFDPDGFWNYAVVVVAFIVLGPISGALLFAVDRDRSLRDLRRRPEQSWNCNWPLIRRTASLGLAMLLMFGISALRSEIS